MAMAYGSPPRWEREKQKGLSGPSTHRIHTVFLCIPIPIAMFGSLSTPSVVQKYPSYGTQRPKYGSPL